MDEIVFSKTVAISNREDISTLCSSNRQLADYIDKRVKDFSTINVDTAMRNLANVGDILKLAYAGSQNFKCSKKILLILSKYQTLIKNSYETASEFVDACISSLKLYKAAINLAEADKLDKALLLVSKTADLAQKMAEEAGKVEIEAQSLCQLSEEALGEAVDDKTVSAAEKKAITERINESKEQQAVLASKTKTLMAEIAE
jgi:hypothetical protein